MKIFLIVLASLIGLIILLAAAGGIGFSRVKAGVRREAHRLFLQQPAEPSSAISESDLEGLPDPVKRHLRYAGVVGRERIRTVRLKMKGSFRLKPGASWINMEAEEYYTTSPPSFIWLGKISPFLFFSVSARDHYIRGKGNMHIRLLSLFTVDNAKGPEMDEASLVRYLNEAMWFPTAYLGEGIRWEAIDDTSARVTISDSGLTASAVCRFDEEGRMVDFIARRLSSTTGKIEEWHTPLSDYDTIDGFRIPNKGEAYYRLPSGDFSYLRLEITEIEFNKDSPY